MDLVTYLKAEFSMSGPLIRELMSFFSGTKEQAAFNAIHRHLRCPVCGAVASARADGDLFYVACDAQQGHTKRLSGNASAELAALDWLLQKEIATPLRWGNPWIDPARWHSRLMKTDFYSSEGLDYFLNLIAEIKIHHHLWAAHKKSDDYAQLPPEHQLLVEAVGLLNKLFKQEVTVALEKCAQFDALPSYQSKLTAIETDIAAARIDVWDKYATALSDSFKQGSFLVLQKLASR